MAREKVAFISYARRDGEVFATALKQRLQEEQPEITLWMDRDEMSGGVDFVEQLRQAIDSVHFLVMVMTPRAILSEWVQKEWRYAREHGVCVCPVKGADDAALDEARKALPRWMSQAHTYDIEKEWDRFTNFLKSPCAETRVPFMAPPLPMTFVARSQVFKAVFEKILDDRQQNPRGKNVVLVGSGGFGKTTLAASLCHDDDVITACDGGILWVTLGQQPLPVRELSRLYSAITGETRTFIDADDAAIQLFAKLETKRCLLVIDDVWDVEHVKPFLRPAPGTTRLMTTRSVKVAGDVTEMDLSVSIAGLTSDESVALLTSRLDPSDVPVELFRQLARRLGEWPLLLELANGALREQLQFEEPVAGALKWVNQALDEAGVTAFDREDAAARNEAIGKTLEASLVGLGDLRERCLELSVFAEDEEIPLALAGVVWKQTDLQTRRMAQRFGNLSLIKLNLAKGTFQMHDATRAYMATQLKDPAQIHGALADAWTPPARVTGDYAMRFAVMHLVAAMSDPKQSAARCRQLLDLLADQRFSDYQHQKDLSSIHRTLGIGLRKASSIATPDMSTLTAALAIAMRGYAVTYQPERLFALAREGELRRADESLELFEADHEWRAAALLTVAWIGAGVKPDQARDLIEKARVVSDVPPLPALREWAMRGPDGIPPGLTETSGGPGLETILAILARAGGVGSQTGVEPLLIEGVYPPGAFTGAVLARFIAEHDGPPLVSFARLNPAANTTYLRQYIAIHAANRYRYYRNRSLVALLHSILGVPDHEWVRQLVEELIVSALTVTTVDFQDGLPLTVWALRARAGDGAAAASLEAYRQELFARSEQLSAERGKSDSWAHYQRRALALCEAYMTALDRPAEALRLLQHARTLPRGFGGFQAASSLTLAESMRLTVPADIAGIDNCITSALESAHRIQDYPFCFQMTCFVRTMQRHWPASKTLNVDDVVTRFVADPQHPEFCPVFVVGEQYEFRPNDENTLPIPHDVRNATTLAAVAKICECSEDGLALLNGSVPRGPDLPPGAEVRHKDPEFAPLLAARLAVEVLASPMDAERRSPLIQQLVPLAASNTTALDTVLSRLLLAAPAVGAIPAPLLGLKLSSWEDGTTPSELILA
jgi:hypothetical protein